MRIPLHKEEILKHFFDLMRRLEQYANLYDAGDKEIATEMSVKLRILFHATNRSKSLTNQLNLDKLAYVSTCKKQDNVTYFPSFSGLVVIRVGGSAGTELVPKFEKDSRKLSFATWWKKQIVLADNKEKEFTRKDLVTSVADMDGGAHVDDSLSREYYELTRKNTIGITFPSGEEQKNINNPVQPSIRQIVYETLITFKDVQLDLQS